MAATGALEDETVSCGMGEGEEATTGTEVVTGHMVDGVITGAVVEEGVVVTTEAEVGEMKEEEVVAPLTANGLPSRRTNSSKTGSKRKSAKGQETQ